MDLTLHQLHIFARVARTRSFTQAAGELLLSQPVLSRTVREIEHKLGTRLLERTTRSVSPTPEGLELLAIAEDLLRRYELGMNRFAAFRAGEHGQVTVAALPSAAAGLLPAVVARFRTRHPGVRVHVLDGTTQEVVEHVRSGAADLGIAEQIAHDDLDVHGLRDEKVLAVLPRGHRFAGEAAVTWQMLAAEPFIAFSPDSSVRRLTDLAFTEAGVVPDTVIDTRTVATAGGMVAAGLGVSAVPELVLPLMAFADVVAAPLISPMVSRRLSVLSRRDEPWAPAVRRFRHELDAPPD
jgi:LysR family transcriptional regulator, carnitine catabolism transcriptional activator